MDLQQLIISTNRVASFPDIVHRVNAAVNSPRHSMENVARIISEDPALSARLLKIANSSLFAFPTPVNTVTRALVMVGTQQLRDLIMASFVTGLFAGVPESLVNMDLFWRHSLACGVAARVLATARREQNVERFYLMGLMHDIGLLVIYTQLPDQAHRALRAARLAKRPLHELEEELFGFHHGTVGGELLHNWSLPDDLHRPVACHHHPTQGGDYRLEAAVVHVADILAGTLAMGDSGEGRIPPLDPAAWELIDLPVTAVTTILERIEKQCHEAANLFY